MSSPREASECEEAKPEPREYLQGGQKLGPRRVVGVRRPLTVPTDGETKGWRPKAGVTAEFFLLEAGMTVDGHLCPSWLQGGP